MMKRNFIVILFAKELFKRVLQVNFHGTEFPLTFESIFSIENKVYNSTTEVFEEKATSQQEVLDFFARNSEDGKLIQKYGDIVTEEQFTNLFLSMYTDERLSSVHVYETVIDAGINESVQVDFIKKKRK